MHELEYAIQVLLDLSTDDLVRFAWGRDGTTVQETLLPLPVFGGRLMVSHLCQVRHEQEAALVHVEMSATPDPKLPETIFRQGSWAWCEMQVPVLSTLYWLVKGQDAPTSPYEWRIGGRPRLQWFFRTITIPALSATTLLNSELPGLLPLVPFTRDASAHIIAIARQQLPTVSPRGRFEQLESLLLFFWDYVQSTAP